MKTKSFLAVTLIGVATLSTQAGVRVGVTIGVPVPAPFIVAPPVVMVPDSYVWDGTEYVGYVNGAYFYLGPGNVWVACGPDQIARFHGWEGGHPDWRDHAIRNERYRNEDRGRSMRHEERDRDHDRGHR
jgi:hypothetical protein